MEKIKEPVALDLIKERLHPGFDEQVKNLIELKPDLSKICKSANGKPD
jgi:hypothetical protein